MAPRHAGTIRRAVNAGFVATLVLLVFGSGLGFVQAAQRPEAESFRFGVPEPQIGDAVAYRESWEVRVGDLWTGWGDSERHSYGWLEDEVLWTGAGEKRLLNRLEYYGPFDDPDEVKQAYGIHPVTKEALLLSQAARREGDGSFGTLTSARYSTSHASQDVRYLRDGYGGQPLCGLLNTLQGSVADRTAGLVLFRDCSPFLPLERCPGGCDWSSPVFRPVAAGSDGEVKAMLFAHEAGDVDGAPLPGDGNATALFRSDVAYPLRIEFELSDHASIRRVWALEGYEEGAGPLSALHVVPGQAPPVELGPRGVTGPDETGFDHPFPLSEAFALAAADANDTSLRDFLEEHPDAYVAAARSTAAGHATGSNGVQKTREELRWLFTVTNGTEALDVEAVRQVERANLGQGRLPEPFSQAIMREHWFTYERPDGPAHFPAPEDIPSELPTLVSVLGVWSAFAEHTFGAEDVPHASFMVFCHRTCATHEWLVAAGASSSRSSFSPSASDPTEVDTTVSNLGAIEVDADGRMLSFWQSAFASQSSLGPRPADPADGPSTPASLAPLSREVRLWTPPNAALVVGAGALAGLAGLGYFVWPQLKGLLGFGLFSRIDKGRAVSHPARAEVMALLEARPGLHFLEIARRTGRPASTVQHHLGKLVENGLLVQRAASGYTCYFPRGAVSRPLMEAEDILKSEGARKVLETLAGGGATGTEIAHATGLTRQTVHHHLVRLREKGLLAEDPRRLALSDLGRQALDRNP